MNEEKKPKNGITEAVSLDNQEFRVRMDRIVKALKDAGYDPYPCLWIPQYGGKDLRNLFCQVNSP